MDKNLNEYNEILVVKLPVNVINVFNWGHHCMQLLPGWMC